RARGFGAHVALADVGEDALRLALERIAEAAAARVGEAEHVAGAERNVARIQAERPDGARVLELEPGARSRIAAEEAGERDRVPADDEEGGRAVQRRQPEARGPAGRGDTLGEATAAERAGDRLLETGLAELHRHQPDMHVRGGDRRRRPRVHDRALGRDDAYGLQDAVRERDVGGEDLVHAHDELRADDRGLRVEEVRALRRRPRVVEQQLPVADAPRAADEEGLLVELDPALRAVLAPRQLADPGLQHPGRAATDRRERRPTDGRADVALELAHLLGADVRAGDEALE